MLPRPGKEHYQFGMRDLVKLVKGLQLASKLFHDNQACPLYLLWYTIYAKRDIPSAPGSGVLPSGLQAIGRMCA